MIDVAELDERIKKCLALLGENPKSQVFAALAESYRRLGDIGRAFSVCKNGLKFHPDYTQAHIVMSKLYLHQGMHDAALKSVRRAIELEGVTRSTDLLEAEILIAMDRLSDARQIVTRLKAGDPNHPAVREVVRKLRERSPKRGLPFVGSLFREPRREGGDKGAQDTAEAADVATIAVAPDTGTMPRSPSVTTWQEWVDVMMRVPHIRAAGVVGSSGNTVASKSAQSGLTDSTAIIQGMATEIAQQCDEAGFGGLSEIRIETSDANIWLCHTQDATSMLVGTAGMPFGRIRREACAHMDSIGSAADISKKPVTSFEPGEQEVS